MKINLNVKLKSLTGEVLKNGDKDMIASDIIAFIISTSKSDNPFKSYMTALRIQKGGVVELSSDDITFIKPLINSNDTFYPVVLGQLIDILETADSKAK